MTTNNASWWWRSISAFVLVVVATSSMGASAQVSAEDKVGSGASATITDHPNPQHPYAHVLENLISKGLILHDANEKNPDEIANDSDTITVAVQFQYHLHLHQGGSAIHPSTDDMVNTMTEVKDAFFERALHILEPSNEVELTSMVSGLLQCHDDETGLRLLSVHRYDKAATEIDIVLAQKHASVMTCGVVLNTMNVVLSSGKEHPEDIENHVHQLGAMAEMLIDEIGLENSDTFSTSFDGLIKHVEATFGLEFHASQLKIGGQYPQNLIFDATYDALRNKYDAYPVSIDGSCTFGCGYLRWHACSGVLEGTIMAYPFPYDENIGDVMDGVLNDLVKQYAASNFGFKWTEYPN